MKQTRFEELRSSIQRQIAECADPQLGFRLLLKRIVDYARRATDFRTDTGAEAHELLKTDFGMVVQASRMELLRVNWQFCALAQNEIDLLSKLLADDKIQMDTPWLIEVIKRCEAITAQIGYEPK